MDPCALVLTQSHSQGVSLACPVMPRAPRLPRVESDWPCRVDCSLDRIFPIWEASTQVGRTILFLSEVHRGRHQHLAPSSLRPSFYGPVADSPRGFLLRAYREFLDHRNGTMDFTEGYSLREELASQGGRVAGPARRARGRRGLQPGLPELRVRRGNLSPQVLALLGFVKMNAGEAYGVELITRMRKKLYEKPDLFLQVERRDIAFEETYHTRILVGAAQHFGLRVEGAWKPPLPLKLLIGTLAHAPGVIFHPVLLASEIAGAFSFQFPDVEAGGGSSSWTSPRSCASPWSSGPSSILVDEVGHIAFNRMAGVPNSLAVAGRMTGLVMQGGAGDGAGVRGRSGWKAVELQKLARVFDSAPPARGSAAPLLLRRRLRGRAPCPPPVRCGRRLASRQREPVTSRSCKGEVMPSPFMEPVAAGLSVGASRRGGLGALLQAQPHPALRTHGEGQLGLHLVSRDQLELVARQHARQHQLGLRERQHPCRCTAAVRPRRESRPAGAGPPRAPA